MERVATCTREPNELDMLCVAQEGGAAMNAWALAEPVWLGTVRIGQLTGSTNENWPHLVDAEGWPLLTDTGRWGVVGADEGANTEHNGRLYIFSGDVATWQRPDDPPLNSDFVAFTDDVTLARHGGHQAEGWRFFLPNDHQGATEATGQPDWRFCPKCNGLFWAPRGDPTGTVCPAGGAHDPVGWRFFLPNDHQGASEATGQPDWRFCRNCHGLFFDGYASKGLCPGAQGGGFRINIVLADGKFDPFQAPPPLGYTVSLETPNAAFSHDGKAYVFAGVAEEQYSGIRRPGNPTPGQYLFSKEDPSRPAELWQTEFLFSPKLGWCANDPARESFVSHNALGFQFVLPHDPQPGPPQTVGGWRDCAKCEAVFWDGDPQFKGVCQRGGPHVADPNHPETYVLEAGLPEDPQNQANWHKCRKCLGLFWAGSGAGLCPASGGHETTDEPVENLRVPHLSGEGIQSHGKWRFCTRCHEMVRSDQPLVFQWLGSYVVNNADHRVLPDDAGQGVVLLGFDGTSFRLAWMPVIAGRSPRFDSVRYYHAGTRRWIDVPDASAESALFRHPFAWSYTHVSLLWQPAAKLWVLLYATAWSENGNYTKPVVARFSSDLVEWTEPVSIFDPIQANAYRRIMHDPGRILQQPGHDTINPDIPPQQPPGKDDPGWAYGAFLLERFTTWDEVARVMRLAYLLSLSAPYHIQVMESEVHLP